MSVLLVGASGTLGESVIRRLVSQGDDVRVIETDPADSPRWQALGAHVARGPLFDFDLVERAGQHARTVVVFEPTSDTIDPVVEGARMAGIERLVICGERLSEGVLDAVRTSPLDYVCLVARPPRRLRPGLAEDDLAAAIDAADDIAGNPRLELDLDDAGSWAELKLPTP